MTRDTAPVPARPRQRFNASTFQRFNASTPQLFNVSTFQPFNRRKIDACIGFVLLL
jgi:hypothetical protein